MRLGRAAACVVGLLAGALAACADTGTRAPAPAAAGAPGAACAADSDCAAGFCDLGACRAPEGVYGAACVPAPRTAEGFRDGKLHACGAYLCLDGRCRSCAADRQCQGELGAPRCAASPGRPGARCGNPG